MKWYSLLNINRSSPDEIVAEMKVSPDSHWFSGHFPGDPILPGVAQLQMVFDTIQAFNKDPLKASGIKKVRFKQIIRPKDGIRIIARRRAQSPQTFSFRVMVKGQLACSGIMVTKALDP